MKKNPFTNKAVQITKPAKAGSQPSLSKVQKGKDLRTSKK